MSRPAILRLAPEFACWPTWDDETGENLDPRHLDLPSDLLSRLLAWDDAWQAGFNAQSPQDSAPPPPSWKTEGAALADALAAHLGPGRLKLRPS